MGWKTRSTLKLAHAVLRRKRDWLDPAGAVENIVEATADAARHDRQSGTGSCLSPLGDWGEAQDFGAQDFGACPSPAGLFQKTGGIVPRKAHTAGLRFALIQKLGGVLSIPPNSLNVRELGGFSENEICLTRA